MYYQPQRVLIFTVDGQGFCLADPTALSEMETLRDSGAAAGAVLAQCGMRWQGSGFGDTIVYADTHADNRNWHPLMRPKAGEFWSGKSVSDATSNPDVMTFIASMQPDLIIVQGRSMADCAPNTGCGIKRALRNMGMQTEVVLALDSGCERVNFARVYENQPYADIPRRVAMDQIRIDAVGIFVPPAQPRQRRAFDTALVAD